MDGAHGDEFGSTTTVTGDPVGTHYGWGNSPFAYKVTMAAAHRGLSLSWCAASLAHCMEAKRRTGMHKTPFVVTANDRWITDSTAICAWLEALTGGPSLWPTNARDRAECALLEDWADEGLGKSAEPWIWMGDGRFPMSARLVVAEQVHVPSRVAFRLMRGFMRRRWAARCNAHGGLAGTRALLCAQMDAIEQRLAGAAWLYGDRASVADFAIAGQLANLVRFRGTADLDARPATAAMVRRACSVLAWWGVEAR